MRDRVCLFVVGWFTSLSSAATGWLSPWSSPLWVGWSVPLLFNHFNPGKFGQVLEVESKSSNQLWAGPFGDHWKQHKVQERKHKLHPVSVNLSLLVETYRGFRVAVLRGHSAIPLWTGHRSSPVLAQGLALRLCSRLLSLLSGCLLTWALPFSGSITLSSVSSNLQCKKLICT